MPVFNAGIVHRATRTVRRQKVIADSAIAALHYLARLESFAFACEPGDFELIGAHEIRPADLQEELPL